MTPPKNRLTTDLRSILPPSTSRLRFSDFEPAVGSLPPELAIILNNAGVSADREVRAANGFQAALDTTKILHDAGVPILDCHYGTSNGRYALKIDQLLSSSNLGWLGAPHAS